jgi:HSP20 family protein
MSKKDKDREKTEDTGEEEPTIDINLGLGGLFKGLGGLLNLVSEMAEKGETEVTREGRAAIRGLGTQGKAMYGFTVRTGLAGIPRVERFGNIVRETEEGPVVEEAREPIVDIFDEKDEILVIAEMPGVEEGGIKLEVKGDILTIAAEDGGRKYSKEVILPAAVDPGAMTSSYKNGILEVKLPKAKAQAKKAKTTRGGG